MEDASKGLAPGWEAVQAEDGRIYWWNTVTTETTWEKPVEVVAKKGIAAGYLDQVKGDAGAASKDKPSLSSTDELEQLRRRSSAGGGISARLAAFQKGDESKEGSTPDRKASTSVAGVTEKFGSTELVGNQAVERQIGMGVAFGQRGPPLLNPTPTLSGRSASSESNSAALKVQEPTSPESPGMVEGRKSSMSVDALKKYREAKQFMAEKDASPDIKATPRDQRAAAKPKVDLYS